jgi:uncharacterized protein
VCLQRVDIGFHQREYDWLRGELEQAYWESKLPNDAGGVAALHDLLVRLRLAKSNR